MFNQISLKKRGARRYLFITILVLIGIYALGGYLPAHSTRISLVTTPVVADVNQSVDWESQTVNDLTLNRTIKGYDHDDAALYQELSRLRAEQPEFIYGETAIVGVENGNDPEQYGVWSLVTDWPVHTTQAALMPNNTILSWHSFLRGVDVYDLSTGEHATTTKWHDSLPTSLFCAAFTHLPDGRLLTGGGNTNAVNQTNISLLFDPADQNFRRTDDLEYPRYYASALTLSNGEVMIFGGNWGDREAKDYPEIYNPQTGFRTLSNVDEPIWHGQYHWVQQAPNGKVIYVGPTQDIAYIDTEGEGTWTDIRTRDALYRSYGSYAMYNIGEILVAGGPIATGGASEKSAYTIEFFEDNDRVAVSKTEDMEYPRRQMMMVVLADGSVLALGGNVSGNFTDWPNGVLPTEIWDPETGLWSEMAPIGRTRQYHAAALLLPDGRVFTGGGGNDAGGANEAFLDAEFFSPPYLFDEDGTLAERPTISAVQDFANHGDTLFIQTVEADEIDRVHLIKLGSSTHSQDMSQRLVPLNFNQTVSGQINALVPNNPNIVVPGYYLLFILNRDGVPSIAKYINIGGQSKLVLNTPGNQENFVGDTVEMTLSAYNPNGKPLTYRVESLPPGLTFDQSNNRIVGTLSDEGSFQSSFQVNSSSESSTVDIVWVVNPANEIPNAAPVITIPESQKHEVGSTILFQIVAVDTDNHLLSFVADGLPDGLSIDRETGLISGVPSRADLFFPIITVIDEVGKAAGVQFSWRIENADLSIVPIKTGPVLVNERVTYSVEAASTSLISYRWNFGDGTPTTRYRETPTSSHTFESPGRYIVQVTLRDGGGSIETHEFAQIVYGTPTTRPPQRSTGILTIPTGDSEEVWNVNPDNNSVTIFDLRTEQKQAEIVVGDNPRSLAQGVNGEVWVVNKGSTSISVIDSQSYTLKQEISLPHSSQPHAIIVDDILGVAYVSLEARGELIKLDLSDGQVLDTLYLGAHIRHLASDGERSTIFVSRFITPPLDGEETAVVDTDSGGGEVLVVDAESFTRRKTIQLQYSTAVDTDHTGSGLPNYLGPLVISPDGLFGYVPSKQDNLTRGLFRNQTELDHDNTIRSISSYVDLGSEAERYPLRIDHDDAAMPVNGVFDKNGVYYFAVMEGSQELRVIDVFSNQEVGTIPTGLAPQQLTLSEDGSHLLVHNYLDRTVMGIDITAISLNDERSATLNFTYQTVSNEELTDQELRGKQIFYEGRDTRLSIAPYMTCASCHADGGHDGRVWDMSGLGEGLRNTPSLIGRAGTAHGRLHWSGNFDEIHDFENQIRLLPQGLGLMSDEDFERTSDPLGRSKAGYSDDLDALAIYITSLNRFEPSPWTPAEGILSANAETGQDIFFQTGCDTCHSGPEFTDSAQAVLHDIGTLKPASGSRLGGALTGIDTPTLRDVWQTAPYLHDGSAPTLKDAIKAHQAYSLSPAELNQVALFLMELGNRDVDQVPVVTPSPAVSITPPSTMTPPSPVATDTPSPILTVTPGPDMTPTPAGPSNAVSCDRPRECIYLPYVVGLEN